ncbi:apolipoprotein acyltransferase [Falsihalocynthiibacter sp. SS001]|uniref:apolipoprotein acyltransferase n=1 Tax=Falsihalocynthiibacter sp. SS001 TaxID=3349698 RepID=UPI0036D2DE13
MNTLLALFAGALVGAMMARKRNGTRLDYLHYMTVFAIIFALLGLIIALIAARAAG